MLSYLSFRALYRNEKHFIPRYIKQTQSDLDILEIELTEPYIRRLNIKKQFILGSQIAANLPSKSGEGLD